MPCGAETNATGSMVPSRWIISTGVEDEATLTVPSLPVSDMADTFMEKANIQSAGPSPRFTWMVVLLGVGVGSGVGVPPPPPQAVS